MRLALFVMGMGHIYHECKQKRNPNTKHELIRCSKSISVEHDVFGGVDSLQQFQIFMVVNTIFTEKPAASPVLYAHA